ncbi:MAG: prepilin-type N-terminal cleavage/methylation domain-containing protein [Synergistaceae bacterium]|jgi:prepilin-type N-terminal cleavage/methylation domain-containing protein|nr:prepilin-type N-terminal cleavage/methylation domain-containing protein [Synergistaceae bacterium]
MVKVRKGFTLVELLIVIVIIGILAAAMLLSSGSATASAEASNVVTELRNLKAASMMLFADSMDDTRASGFATLINGNASAAKVYLGKYMDNPEKLTTNFLLKISTVGGGPKWFVGYNLTGAKVTDEVKDKLAGRAKSTGLLAGAASDAAPTTLSTYFEKSDSSVWLVAR